MSRRRVIGSVPGGLIVHDPQHRVMWVLPDPKQEQDPAVASGLALRNRATLEGVCPECGGEERLRRGAIVIEHEPGCPAETRRLTKLIRRSRRRRRKGAGGGNR